MARNYSYSTDQTPNGYLIDGPVLDMKLRSGIGMFPIPISHGLTVGEFAQMLNGEGWLANKEKCNIKIIPVANYDHDMQYTFACKAITQFKYTTKYYALSINMPVLKEWRSIMVGVLIFLSQFLGSPDLKGKYSFSYTPIGIKGMAETPLYMNQVCYGLDLRDYDINILRKTKRINIQWMIELYNAYPFKEKFLIISKARK